MTQNERHEESAQNDGSKPSRQPTRANHIPTALVCAAMAAGMLGMAYAAVPLYQMFCRATGYGGTTKVATTLPDRVLDQTISIRFDANVSANLPWTFKPLTRTMVIKPGESKIATYTATNNSDTTLVGTAAFNVTPESAGLYFNKIECFCFTEQILKPGETAQLPVSFFIDPEIMADKNTRHLTQITLSYTFFPTESDDGDGNNDGKQASGKKQGTTRTGG